MPRSHRPRSLPALAIVAALAGTCLLQPTPARSQESDAPTIDPGYLLVRDLMEQGTKPRKEAAAALIERDDPALAAGIVDALFFIPIPLRAEAVEALEALTDRSDVGRRYWDWVEIVGAMDDVAPAPGYAQWKAILLSQIDEGYREILYQGVPHTIRLEEVVTGGVRIEGIPALDDPRMVPAAEADYLKDDEQIFGVDLGGEQRAYPLRFLDWHEMLNDVVGGVPVTLSYCTLCGSGVLYATAREGKDPRRFGTSGLLYRSNKLMIDRETKSLWSNLLGEPVVGSLVGSGQSLELLPHTRTSWADWKTTHPQTLVVDLDRKLRRFGAGYGFDYRPGLADEARRGVSFPVWSKSDALGRDDEIFALRAGSASLAFPLETLYAAGIVHATLGDVPVVVLADGASGAVRAFDRGAATFALRPDGTLEAQGGTVYRVTEQALVSEAGDPLPRRPGHFAFWFGWYAFYPQTEVWSPEESPTLPPAVSDDG